MKRTKLVGSSNIDEIGYNPDDRVLQIKFHSGKVYNYHPITVEGFNEFMKAESKGSFFAKNIKNNPTVNFTQVDEVIN